MSLLTYVPHASHLRVARRSHVRPPFRGTWVAGRESVVEIRPAGRVSTGRFTHQPNDEGLRWFSHLPDSGLAQAVRL